MFITIWDGPGGTRNRIGLLSLLLNLPLSFFQSEFFSLRFRQELRLEKDKISRAHYGTRQRHKVNKILK